MQTLPMLSTVLLAALALPTAADRIPPIEASVPEARVPEAFVIESGAHEVRTLIDQLAEATGQNHIYSEQDFANVPDGSIRLQNPITVNVEDALGLVTKLAFLRGFGRIERDADLGLYEWVAIAGPKRVEWGTTAKSVSIPELMADRQTPRVVTVTVPLAHLNANAATNQLRPFFSMGGGSAATLTLGAAGDSLLISGVAHQVAAAVEHVLLVDQPPKRTGKTEVRTESSKSGR